MMICCVFNLFYRAIKSVEELKNGTELHNTHRIVGQYMYFVHKISALLAIHTILKRFVPRKATCGSAPIRSTWSQRRPVVSRCVGHDPRYSFAQHLGVRLSGATLALEKSDQPQRVVREEMVFAGGPREQRSQRGCCAIMPWFSGKPPRV